MYMFIGGTNFGFSTGALHTDRYMPIVTSYDYDALLTECGDITEKYLAVRNVIAQYTDKTLPPVPKNREKAAYGKFSATASAELFENLEKLSVPIATEVPKCMEDYGVGYGYIVYRTELNRDYANARLFFESIGDRAQIYINDGYKGMAYINEPPYEVAFSAKRGDILSVVCENMGRTNFGPKMMRKKGIVGRCLIDGKIHFGWNVYPLAMDNINKLSFRSDVVKNGKTFYKFEFVICCELNDTFLRTDNFKKGFVVLNGFNLGRYWEIDPQKTLYVPKSLLKAEKNELIIFESEGLKGEPIIEFTDTPELG